MAAGHRVTICVSGPYSIQSEPARTLIVTGPDRITIERSQILFNGILWVKTPEGARESICLTKHERTIVATAEVKPHAKRWMTD